MNGERPPRVLLVAMDPDRKRKNVIRLAAHFLDEGAHVDVLTAERRGWTSGPGCTGSTRRRPGIPCRGWSAPSSSGRRGSWCVRWHGSVVPARCWNGCGAG
ncbi:hypothetical protein BKA00_006274 [Actinomadura coerulea]|uniref:Uncharacterized protein n=1 Tax=Actinomadura coerulea TaxID=46159 RepID=A0A7X0L299_9ACTN|nr:hypothetical protein [Actinomadura coerulea]MBB6399360.1 hypothetical protein [Actinomadura coerulea]